MTTNNNYPKSVGTQSDKPVAQAVANVFSVWDHGDIEVVESGGYLVCTQCALVLGVCFEQECQYKHTSREFLHICGDVEMNPGMQSSEVQEKEDIPLQGKKTVSAGLGGMEFIARVVGDAGQDRDSLKAFMAKSEGNAALVRIIRDMSPEQITKIGPAFEKKFRSFFDTRSPGAKLIKCRNCKKIGHFQRDCPHGVKKEGRGAKARGLVLTAQKNEKEKESGAEDGEKEAEEAAEEDRKMDALEKDLGRTLFTADDEAMLRGINAEKAEEVLGPDPEPAEESSELLDWNGIRRRVADFKVEWTSDAEKDVRPSLVAPTAAVALMGLFGMLGVKPSVDTIKQRAVQRIFQVIHPGPSMFAIVGSAVRAAGFISSTPLVSQGLAFAGAFLGLATPTESMIARAASWAGISLMPSISDMSWRLARSIGAASVAVAIAMFVMSLVRSRLVGKYPWWVFGDFSKVHSRIVFKAFITEEGDHVDERPLVHQMSELKEADPIIALLEYQVKEPFRAVKTHQFLANMTMVMQITTFGNSNFMLSPKTRTAKVTNHLSRIQPVNMSKADNLGEDPTTNAAFVQFAICESRRTEMEISGIGAAFRRGGVILHAS